jgi:hypothetical protein
LGDIVHLPRFINKACFYPPTKKRVVTVFDLIDLEEGRII